MKRVLYIDDEMELLSLAACFFEEENLPIDICSDFNQALELTRKHKYDMIITDAKMPSGCGHDLTRLIKEEGNFQGKMILVTGEVDDTYIGGHYDHILYKPVQFQELISMVKEFLKI